MEFVLIDIDTSEWNYMWDWLENHPINEGIPDSTISEYNGERWQYTGSYYLDGSCVHTFRHKCHPTTNNVKQLSLNNSDNFSEDQIIKRYKI